MSEPAGGLKGGTRERLVRNGDVLLLHPSGEYRFLEGIEPYSCGVIAAPGWEMVRVPLPALLPWQEGFEYVEQFLGQEGLPRQALCAMELRSPKPFPMEGFIEFNRGYCETLQAWGLLVDGRNPIARTNVAPVTHAPEDVSLHAFTVVRPRIGNGGSTFVVAGAGELREGILDSGGIVHHGDVSPEGILAKCGYVLKVMEDRLKGLGVGWGDVTRTNVYTVHPLDERVRDRLLESMGPAARWGIHWHVTRPPVVDIEFEMDLSGL